MTSIVSLYKPHTASPLRLSDIQQDPVLTALLLQADKHLEAVGAPESGMRHSELVSRVAGEILHSLDHAERTIQLAEIAGYIHDIGNVVCRQEHATSGGYIALRRLQQLGMDVHEAAEIAAAIANHEGSAIEPVSLINAALIIANYADVHRSRVRNAHPANFTPTESVHFAVIESEVHVDAADRQIRLVLTIDTSISPVLDYFNLYLNRTITSRRAAQFLECSLMLIINDNRLL